MKETSFINQNKDKWRRFEELNKSKQGDPDEISRLFVEITEDLSYARTHYPKRSVRVYLNYIAQGIFTSLYKIKNEPFSKFLTFWSTSLPLEMYRARKNLLLAFLIFVIAGAIGLVSTADDLNFARVILSDGYVEMTDRYIEKGDPMAVYKQQSGMPMFLEIFFNNIRVAFFSFALGIFFSIGTGFFLVYNGIMVGSFQSYFYYKGLTVSSQFGSQLLLTTFLTIWIHGAFEISALIIAGAAGMTLGNGLLFPGTYSKLQSLQISAKRGLFIMLGVTPVVFLAAVFESWVTRHTEMPDVTKWIIILGSFAIMILYFVVYPFVVAARHPEKINLNEEPLFHPERKIDFFKIRQVNEMFSDAFALYRNHFSFIIKVIFTCFFLHAGIMATVFVQHYRLLDQDLWWYEVLGILFCTGKTASVWQFFATAFVFSLLVSGVIYSVEKTDKKYLSWLKFHFTGIHKFFIPVTLLFAGIAFLPGEVMFFFALFAPVLFYTIASVGMEKNNIFNSLSNAIGKGFTHWGNNFLLQLVLALIIAAFFLMNVSMLMFAIVLPLIEWHIITQFDAYWVIIAAVKCGMDMLFLWFVCPLMIYGFILAYFTVREKEEATGLYEKMKRFGKKNKTLETEGDYED
ncbi:MAG: stage II sporulation protein M [Bacteroidota bacterium]